MKTACLLALTLALTSVHAQRLTTADPNFPELSQLSQSIGWYQVSGTNAWSIGDGDVNASKGANCMVLLDKVRAAGVPDTRTLEISWSGPEFKSGVHTMAEIRTSCEHAARIGRIKGFERWALLAMQSGTNYKINASYYSNCIKTYNEIIKSGVSPSERIPERDIAGKTFGGPIEEVRKTYCDVGAANATAQTAASEEPFRKELKDDKLRIALKYGSVFIPGGVGTADAHKMAAASVWFLDLSPPKHCVDGQQVHTIRRYHFDANQHLTSTTAKDYCGRAPRSAFQ